MEHFGNIIQLILLLLLLKSAYVRTDIANENEIAAQNSLNHDPNVYQPWPDYNYYNTDVEKSRLPVSIIPLDIDLNNLAMAWISKVENETFVLRLDATDQSAGQAKMVVFSKIMFMRFHDCLCDGTSVLCCAEIDETSNVTSIVTQNTNNIFISAPFICILQDMIKIDCLKQSIPFPTTAPVMHIYGATCGGLSVFVFWDMSQLVILQFTFPWLRSNGSGSHHSGTTTSNIDTTILERTSRGIMFPPATIDNLHTSNEINKAKDDDKTLPNTFIGIIVGCVVILMIAIIIVSLLFVRQRRKSRETSRASPLRSSNSESKVRQSQDLNFPEKNMGNQRLSRKCREVSRSTSSAKVIAESHNSGNRSHVIAVKGNPMHNIYTTHGRNDSVDIRHNNAAFTVSDHVYTSIDDALEIRNEYTSLDESTKYGHLYDDSFTTDPKLRPAVPLPPFIANQTLPYYSVAKPNDVDFPNQNNDSDGSTNENGETVSTHYLELLDENIIPNLQISHADYLVPISITSMRNDKGL